MKQSNSSENQIRIYHDENVRTKRVNRYLVLGISIMYLLYIVLIARFLLREDNVNDFYIANIVVLALSVVCFILNLCFIKKSPSSKILRYIAVGGYTLVYCVLIYVISDYYAIISLIVVLLGCILYYDHKFMVAFSSLLFLINLVHTAAVILSGESTSAELEVIRMIVILIFSSTLCFSTKIGKAFLDDTVGSVMDERNNIDIILAEVLELSAVVKTNIDNTSVIINELNDTTDTVNRTVEEIANSTNSVSESIINQTQMTGEIQEGIRDTENKSNNVVAIVKESTESIQDSIIASRQLKDNTLEIASINKDVSGAMNELQLKVQEVNAIINVILDISTQTNLLALNASIEAARAGDSGKGFAVVAGEIGTLSQKTRESTENIVKILNELNEKALYASNIVNRSVEVSTNQNDSINHVTESIDKLNSNMNVLSDNITDINQKIIHITNSNQTIVDNITQVSAVCEEITASTENATGITNQSKSMAENAVQMLKEVLDAAKKMDSYNTK